MGSDQGIPKDDGSGKIGLDGLVVNDRPRISAVKKGVEIFNPDLNGGVYAAVGIGGGYRTVGGEIGYRFKETDNGIKVGGVLSAYYNLLSGKTDANLKLSVAKDAQLDNGIQTQVSLTTAYNASSGAYASASARAAYPISNSYGPFNNITPYASATVSTKAEGSNLTAGVTTNIDVGSANLRLNVGVKVEQGGPKAMFGVALKF